MAKVLQEKNQIILWTDDFLFFEWKIDILDSVDSSSEREYFSSSFFKLDGTAESQLLFLWKKVRGTSMLYLYTSANLPPRKAKTVITDSNKSVIYDVVAFTEDLYHPKLKYALAVNINNTSSKSFPLTIVGIIYNTSFIQQSQSTEKYTITNKSCSTDSTSMNSLPELSVHFKKLLASPIYSDIVLNVEDVSIKAHKNVLHARSPVFQKMLSYDTTEAAENIIVVSDISAEVAKKLVAYLYTGEKETCTFEECCELYYAADKYEVLSLREACRVELLTHLKVDNGCTLFGLANRHSDEVFVKEVVRFINSNFKSVVETKSFDELKKEEMKFLVQSHTRSMN